MATGSVFPAATKSKSCFSIESLVGNRNPTPVPGGDYPSTSKSACNTCRSGGGGGSPMGPSGSPYGFSSLHLKSMIAAGGPSPYLGGLGPDIPPGLAIPSALHPLHLAAAAPHPGTLPMHPSYPFFGASHRESSFGFYPYFLSRHRFLGPRYPGSEGPGGSLLPFRKAKRIRTAFSPSQLLRLENAFDKNHYVVGAERKQLASSLNLSETQVKVWFQNRRTKFKRMKAEEEGGIDSDRLNDMHDDDDDTHWLVDEDDVECSSDNEKVEEEESTKLNREAFVEKTDSPTPNTERITPQNV